MVLWCSWFSRDPIAIIDRLLALLHSSVGDLGHLDDADYVYLDGRRSDLIITGGANVYPAEVEAVIGTHNVTQLRVQHLAERFEVAGFVGKTLHPTHRMTTTSRRFSTFWATRSWSRSTAHR